MSCRTLIIVVTLMAPLVIAAPAQARELETVDELLDELEQRATEVAAISCELEQEKELTALQRPVKLSGTLLFMPPDHLKLELEGDENLSVYANADELCFVDHDLDEVERMSVAAGFDLSSVLPGFAPGQFAAHRDELEITLARGESPRYRLEITTPGGEVWNYRRAVLELDGQLRLERSVVELTNGDRVTTRYRHWQRHGPISPHAFACPAPAPLGADSSVSTP